MLSVRNLVKVILITGVVAFVVAMVIVVRFTPAAAVESVERGSPAVCAVP